MKDCAEVVCTNVGQAAEILSNGEKAKYAGVSNKLGKKSQSHSMQATLQLRL